MSVAASAATAAVPSRAHRTPAHPISPSSTSAFPGARFPSPAARLQTAAGAPAPSAPIPEGLIHASTAFPPVPSPQSPVPRVNQLPTPQSALPSLPPVPSAQSPVPASSRGDILADYWNPDLSLFQIAARNNISLFDLLEWLQQPTVIAAIELVNAAETQRAARLAANAATLATSALIRAASAPSAETARRAATTILRHARDATRPARASAPVQSPRQSTSALPSPAPAHPPISFNGHPRTTPPPISTPHPHPVPLMARLGRGPTAHCPLPSPSAQCPVPSPSPP